MKQHIEPEYRLNNGRYAFYLDDELLFETEEVAVLIDRSNGVLLKHGDPEVVTAAQTKQRNAYLAHGLAAEADDLICFIGKFAIEDLNKMVAICDYAGRFFQKLLATVRRAPPPETAEDLSVFRAARSASPAGEAMREHLGMAEGSR